MLNTSYQEMTKLILKFDNEFCETGSKKELSPTLRSTGNIYIDIGNHNSKVGNEQFDKDEIKEIRDYMIELKSFYEMFQHADENIVKLEKGQNTICPSFLDDETFDKLRNFFSRFECFYQKMKKLDDKEGKEFLKKCKSNSMIKNIRTILNMKSRIVSTLVELQILAMTYYEDSLHLQLDKKKKGGSQFSDTFPIPDSKENKENVLKHSNVSPHHQSYFETLKPSQKLTILSIALSKIPNTRKSNLSIMELRSILNNMEAYHSPIGNNYKLSYEMNGIEAIEEKVSREIITAGERTAKKSTLSKGSNAKFNFDNEDSVEKDDERESFMHPKNHDWAQKNENHMRRGTMESVMTLNAPDHFVDNEEKKKGFCNNCSLI